ncbi:MAG: carbohydrate ABC transporter permease [Rhodospirillales bacterium]|nr:carbohydrate ABC transporter permease [Rhodospirillales bacterium]
MSATTLSATRAKPNYRLRRLGVEAGSILLGLFLVVWSLAPVYNMVMVALDSHDDVFSSHIFPPSPSLHSFWVVVTEGYWYLSYFWSQFANSFYVGFGTTFFTLLIGSLTTFVIGRMRLKGGWIISNLALVTYVIPASFVAIPYYRIMHIYGWGDSLWAVISAYVAFGVPYAIIVFQQYGVSIPIALDESARIDGASPWQVYWRIYLPLMSPALVAVGTFSLLLAWNDYLYQFLLLSSKRNMTVAVVLAQFLNSDEAPWNYMMATAIIYSIPPIATYYAFRKYMTSGLTMGGVKG